MAKQSYKQSKKAAFNESLSALDNLGTSKDDVIFADEFSALESACADFILRVKANIAKEPNFVKSGKIEDITMETVGDQIAVSVRNYLIFQSRGVSGTKTKYDTPHAFTNKRPPIDIIKQSIKDGNFRLRNEAQFGTDNVSPTAELTEEEQITKAAWAISTHIFQHGIRPKHLFENEIPLLISDIKLNLSKFVVQQLVLDITGEFKNTPANRIILK